MALRPRESRQKGTCEIRVYLWGSWGSLSGQHRPRTALGSHPRDQSSNNPASLLQGGTRDGGHGPQGAPSAGALHSEFPSCKRGFSPVTKGQWLLVRSLGQVGAWPYSIYHGCSAEIWHLTERWHFHQGRRACVQLLPGQLRYPTLTICYGGGGVGVNEASGRSGQEVPSAAGPAHFLFPAGRCYSRFISKTWGWLRRLRPSLNALTETGFYYSSRSWPRSLRCLCPLKSQGHGVSTCRQPRMEVSSLPRSIVWSQPLR